jgi:hypothetical protein
MELRRDRFLEEEADALIAALPADDQAPACAERLLLRRGRRAVAAEGLIENAEGVSQSMREELRFLVSVTRISADERLSLGLWIDGWNQREIARTLNVCQQRVSQLLRAGIRRCYANLPLSFREFSRHTIYRPPSHSHRETRVRKCSYCGETYSVFYGCGRYCSSGCRERAYHKNIF